MTSLRNFFRSLYIGITTRLSSLWKKYRGLKRWLQWAIAILVAILLVAGFALAHGGKATDASPQERTVTLASVSSLSGNGDGVSILGSVRSVTEADLLAQTGGTVRSVNTKLGASVSAGAVIAELDNASEAAQVLQAEGAYDAAIAARSAQSLPDTRASAADTYAAAYTTVDTILENDIDQFFGGPTATGPRLLINQGPSKDLDRKRDALGKRIIAWQQKLGSAASADPATLLAQATTDTQAVSEFLLELSAAANDRDSRATPEQIAALASARANIDATLAKLAAAKGSLRTGTVGATASADASVKQALGVLRGAQANLEKTRIRATIGGTVNFLSVHVGDYVTAFTHVATVAQNGALEIVAYVSESDRQNLTAGMKVQVEGGYTGIITTVAPALDPTTKQIEVDIAVDTASAPSGTPALTNGQSVRITLPNSAPAAAVAPVATSSVQLIPLTAVKLMANSRSVFTVGSDGRLVAHPVTIGEVRGDRIEVLTGLTGDMRIVTDVRGLSEGQKVNVATDS
ncbi:MAG: efflux RND transporter periplasmic adaptor subunit [Patescibacteria group bacterium]